MSNKERIALVVGACGLDRLLTVPKYPEADAKVRTTAYNEIGGGNAANSAAAMARLTDATFLQRSGDKDTMIRVKYLGKVGQDQVGQKLLDELNDSNVDTSSPLCLRGPPGSTTSFTTIIVSEQEHTRTCLHTPGSCGELTVEDCQNVDMDCVFENVVHLHSDARHTSASLYLARQAKQRGITVSCDCEKDRHNQDLDRLLEISDIVFTNSGYLGDYLARLTRQLEQERNIAPLLMPATTVDTATSSSMLGEQAIEAIINSLTPSAFLARWYPQLGRQVIVTQGRMGALHFKLNHIQRVNEKQNQQCGPENAISITRKEAGGATLYLNHRHNQSTRNIQETEYLVQPSGVLLDVSIVDTTGAGDAFIGGYLLAMLANDDENDCSDRPLRTSSEAIAQEHHTGFAMNFGSWVAGKKLEHPGVRNALPRGNDVDDMLGLRGKDLDDKLRRTISPFAAGSQLF